MLHTLLRRRAVNRAARAADAVEERLRIGSPLRRTINKVFPDHWSFLLGEIALYSFVMLLLTGTFLALFFDPSAAESVYRGSYTPLRNIPLTQAYRSTMDLSFDVRGGLLIRQMHHWSANLFMAAIVVHMLRIFFTGAFRKPREANWLTGMALFWLGFMEGFCGYSLPDDGLSGTGLRIAYSIMLSIPIAGTWLSTSLFGGEFPGTAILGRLYIAHVWIIPALIIALISVHLALLVKQKHTQWRRPGHTAHNVVGTRMVPAFAMGSTGLAVLVFAVIAALGGLLQINPVWLWGPFEANAVTANSQPDWYVWFLEGAMRLFPAWDIRAFGYTVPAPFWPAVVLPGVLATLAIAYPWLDRRATGDTGRHELLRRPRDAPGRTALGAMAVTFYLVLSTWAADDTIAQHFHLDLNATVWVGRVAVLLLPPLAFYAGNRLALNLQQHDRMVLHEGIETGLIRRAADGRYIEIRQPLGRVDEHGHGEFEYADWVVPKRPNDVLGLRKSVLGFFAPIPLTDGAPDARPDGQPEPPSQLAPPSPLAPQPASPPQSPLSPQSPLAPQPPAEPQASSRPGAGT
jgi:ubiquinol-cytochrome c reductase cytochrome b subunit